MSMHKVAVATVVPVPTKHTASNYC